MDSQLKKLITIYTITGFMMLVTVFIRMKNNKDLDFMTKKIVTSKCDNWCVSHSIMYFTLGLLSPKYWYISFILSIFWEYFELFMEKNNLYLYSNIRNDIITNTSSLIIGMITRNLLFNNIL